MTSYARLAAEGRATARETNTAFKLRTITEYREEHHDDAWEHGGTVVYGLLVGACGHTVELICQPRPYDRKAVGRRKRCRQCPADPPRPLPVDHCAYGIGGEFGERDCPTRARFVDDGQPGYGLLCGKHHGHLLRQGYLEAPCPRYRPDGAVEQPTTPAPFVPELSPPVRGHLSLVN